MAKASMVQCPHCSSYNVSRMQMHGEHAGKMDKCRDCEKSWPTKPGTLTAEQHKKGEPPEPGDDDKPGMPEMPEMPMMANKYM